METQIEKRAPAQNVVEAIKKEAKNNPLFSSVCYIFATRQRARAQVTLSTLMHTMNREGYEVSKEDCLRVLRFMANQGLGTLKYNNKNQVVALINIKYTLQSVGKVAFEDAEELHSFNSKEGKVLPKYKKLEAEIPNPLPTTPAEAIQQIRETKKGVRSYSIFLTVMINGSPVIFPGPSNMPPNELGLFLLNFNNLVKEKGHA